jgi:hypothetical protein
VASKAGVPSVIRDAHEAERRATPSVDFARHVLQQHHTRVVRSLLDFDALSRSTVLELGYAFLVDLPSTNLTHLRSGTGMLAVALSPICQRYMATDIPELVPLIRKNIELNLSPSVSGCAVTAEALDWAVVHNVPSSTWHKLQLLSGSTSDGRDQTNSAASPNADLVLVVDCIYHPSLIPPLLSTLEYLGSQGGQPMPSSSSCTDVLVVAELRAEDVVREFLDRWLALGGWQIWSLNTGEPTDNEDNWTVHSCGDLGARYAVWLGRKEPLLRDPQRLGEWFSV